MSAAVGHPPGGRACGNATLMEMSFGNKKRRDHKVPDAMPRQAHQELLACKPTPHYNCPHQAQMRSRCALVRRPLTAAQRRHRPAPCMSRRSFPQALAPFCNRTIASNSTPPCPASERLSGLGAQSSGKPVAGPAPTPSAPPPPISSFPRSSAQRAGRSRLRLLPPLLCRTPPPCTHVKAPSLLDCSVTRLARAMPAAAFLLVVVLCCVATRAAGSEGECSLLASPAAATESQAAALPTAHCPAHCPSAAGWSTLATLSPGSTNPCGTYAPAASRAFCWGRQLSPNGQLANYSEPVPVPSSASWRQLSSGHYVNSTTGLFDDFTCGAAVGRLVGSAYQRWLQRAASAVLLHRPSPDPPPPPQPPLPSSTALPHPTPQALKAKTAPPGAGGQTSQGWACWEQRRPGALMPRACASRRATAWNRWLCPRWRRPAPGAPSPAATASAAASSPTAARGAVSVGVLPWRGADACASTVMLAR